MATMTPCMTYMQTCQSKLQIPSAFPSMALIWATPLEGPHAIGSAFALFLAQKRLSVTVLVQLLTGGLGSSQGTVRGVPLRLLEAV